MDKTETRKALQIKFILAREFGMVSASHMPSNAEVAKECCKTLGWDWLAIGISAKAILLRYWEELHPNAKVPLTPSQKRKREKAPKDFYETREWQVLRYQALKLNNGACQCCGNTAASSGNALHVDHVKPRSRFPELALELSNLQVLCRYCNLGKGAWDQTDWRPAQETLQ